MTRFPILLALTTLVACSTESKDDDTASNSETTEETETGGEEEEEESTDCTYNGFEADFVNAYYNEDGWYISAASADDEFTFLQIEQETDEVPEPGVYSLAGSTTEDCDFCVYIGQCADEECEELTGYFTTEGSLEIVSIDAVEGGTVEVKLTDVVMYEVSIESFTNEDGEEDAEIEVLEDGRTWCVDAEYSAELEEEEEDDWWGDDDPGVGEALPDLTAPDQNGDDVTLSDLLGTMTVVMFNTHDWCPPCVVAAENSEALWWELRERDDRYDVSFVQLLYQGADWETDEESPADQDDAAEWASRFGITHPVLHGEEARRYFDESGSGGFPTFWIVDPLGMVRAFEAGAESVTTETVQEQFEAFLEENPDWTPEDHEHDDDEHDDDEHDDETTGDDDTTGDDETTGDDATTDEEADGEEGTTGDDETTDEEADGADGADGEGVSTGGA